MKVRADSAAMAQENREKDFLSTNMLRHETVWMLERKGEECFWINVTVESPHKRNVKMSGYKMVANFNRFGKIVQPCDTKEYIRLSFEFFESECS